MDIIVGGRGTGKTIELIKRSAETGSVIFVLTYQRAEHIEDIAKKLGYDIPKPEVIRISSGWIDYIDMRLGTPMLIDDVDELLSYIFPRFKIEAIALNGNVKEIEQVEDGRKPMPTREMVAAAIGIDKKDVCCSECIWSCDTFTRSGLVECKMKYKTVECESYCKLFMPKSEGVRK